MFTNNHSHTITSRTSGGVINGTWYTNNTMGGLPPGTIVGIDPAYYPNSTTSPHTYTTTTTIPNTGSIIPTNKRCRDCNHAHLNNECVKFADWGAVTFVKCTCKEYAPKDNLEYLEHLYDKKERSKDSPAIPK